MLGIVCFLLITGCLAQEFKMDESFQFPESIEKEHFKNATFCMFNTEQNSIFCHGPMGSIECDAFSNTSSVKYPSYGIGKLSDHSNSESIKYFLYPRNLEKQNYFNYSLELDGKSIDMYLYHSNSADEYGFRVSDFKCFQGLVNLFKSSDHFHDAKIDGTDSSVKLIGEVLYLDKSIMKRWFYNFYYPYYSWYSWPYSLWWF
ncbi:hypothetical protein BpHYR1_030445 [Brachionus plicatilis]|uniref:Uncharacterized protein n=1 Tax=Brachionus plicatilis TaxID=10195 RepID=A0A3M7QTF4_BRAPC|nr:hypothetical protein BpHYR1_030445 [Brachionus plicatilis]